MKKIHTSKIIILLIFSIFFSKIVNSQVLTDNSYKLMRVLSYVTKYYVDSTDQEQLVDDAIVRMLKDLDPHSVYVTKDEVKALNEPLKGSFDGIGIQFNILNDTILVVLTISGGPSERVGIRAGDRIIKIEEENVAGIGIKNSGVRKHLLGEKGTKVSVSIKRRGVHSLLDFTIERDKIPIFSLDASYKVNKNTGYIKLNKFSATTMDEYEKAFTKLEKDGMKNLILDLRGNGGGYLRTSIDLASEFLSKNKLVVYTEGLNSPKEEYLSQKRGSFEKGKLVVLIDEGSASASEIVTGAIQDWDRGIVIGRRSFGKGLVQRPFYLPDGSMIRLTTARYFTPTGRLIQKSYEKGSEEYRKDLSNRYKNGELSNKDSIHAFEGKKFNTLKNKRNVYGGGGIMPDIFVPMDTSGISDYYGKLIREGILNSFTLNFLDENRRKIKKQYSKFSSYKSDFIVTDNILNDLVQYAKKEAVVYDEEEFETSKANIRLSIKANIASNIWGTSQYFEIVNDASPAFLKAVEVIENKELYSQQLKTK